MQKRLDERSVNSYNHARLFRLSNQINGEMSEWLKEHAWKACMWETASGVRIPLSPPFF